MYSPVTLIALGLLSAASIVNADLAWAQYQPTYKIGSTYLITFNFGIKDPVPNEAMTLSYGPAPAADAQPDEKKFLDIAPAIQLTENGSATLYGANWTVGNQGSLSHVDALLDKNSRWRFAAHGSEKLENGQWKWFQAAKKDFQVLERGLDDPISIDPIISATPVPTATTAGAGPASTSGVTATPSATESAPNISGSMRDASISPFSLMLGAAMLVGLVM